jgi:phosphoenolpyruvate synthase/pyruvate phosphate dikinase
MSTAFGAKCANMATMKTFGFTKETIPDGFGIPFYFYREFMEYNKFFDKLKLIVSDSAFKSDPVEREKQLSNFRETIKNGQMPTWMLSDLGAMQDKFGKQTQIRCRSSTNNEDLPNFSGAGLYDSKTHKPAEGHIAKTIKEVYASIWNFRAFEERDFYRIDNYSTSMGLLCHPNYTDEQMNGVAVSTDPVYKTNNSFYLNNQLGEDLVTNPEALSMPEEILLDSKINSSEKFSIIRYSSLSNSKLLLNEKYFGQMRNNLAIIHNRFKKLYKTSDDKAFAMEIEYKITKAGKLIIKQARPWVGNNSILNNVDFDEDLASKEKIKLQAKLYPNPFIDFIKIDFETPISGIVNMQIFTSNGSLIFTKELGYYAIGKHFINVNMAQFKNQGGVLLATISVTGDNLIIKTYHKLLQK